MKKGTKIALGTVLVLGLIGACSDKEETEVKEEQIQTEQIEEQEVEEEVIVEEEVKLPGVGEVAEADKYSVVVNEVSEVTVLTSDNMFQDDLTTNGKFIVINLTIKNKQSSQENYSYSDVKLTSGDMTFSALDSLDINIIFEDYLWFIDVNPQMSTTSTVVFEVPADLDTYHLEMGIFDTVEIELK